MPTHNQITIAESIGNYLRGQKYPRNISDIARAVDINRQAASGILNSKNFMHMFQQVHGGYIAIYSMPITVTTVEEFGKNMVLTDSLVDSDNVVATTIAPTNLFTPSVLPVVVKQKYYAGKMDKDYINEIAAVVGPIIVRDMPNYTDKDYVKALRKLVGQMICLLEDKEEKLKALPERDVTVTAS